MTCNWPEDEDGAGFPPVIVNAVGRELVTVKRLTGSDIAVVFPKAIEGAPVLVNTPPLNVHLPLVPGAVGAVFAVSGFWYGVPPVEVLVENCRLS